MSLKSLCLQQNKQTTTLRNPQIVSWTSLTRCSNLKTRWSPWRMLLWRSNKIKVLCRVVSPNKRAKMNSQPTSTSGRRRTTQDPTITNPKIIPNRCWAGLILLGSAEWSTTQLWTTVWTLLSPKANWDCNRIRAASSSQELSPMIIWRSNQRFKNQFRSDIGIGKQKKT